MKIKVITASAGSGKTTRLSQVLDDAIASGRVRPDGIVATTFTRHAAAELIERARGHLLASGRGREAHQLLAARIGTVNSVCGALVTDFAFELGMSPVLRVLDEATAEIEQKRALAAVVSQDVSDELDGYKQLFDREFDWQYEVRQMIAAARSNGLAGPDLRASVARSTAALDACLGPVAPDGDALDADLRAAIETAIAVIGSGDGTKVTAGYLDLLRDSLRRLNGKRLRWGDWAKLAKDGPGKKSDAAAAPVRDAAARHLAHPRLRRQMKQLIERVFDVAASGLTAYQDHKRTLGVIDFVDQEALALELLRRPDVRAALEGQLDLVLIDEFQDTSPLQLAIFLELAALARESVWVGDQKQAIYGFRGTDPALMDAMIESLTSPTSDPELIGKAVAAAGATGELETLSTSYRSRPELVHLTSDIFARAFVHHGIPEERTRLVPKLTTEPAGLGVVVERWQLECPARDNKEMLAACAATGVRDLLASSQRVRDRATGELRSATASDVAVLCRTNEQCQLVADALARLDLRAVVPQMGLLSTAEGQLVLAGLALWIDPRDSLAAARLARLVTHAGDLDALVTRALAAPGHAAFVDDPLVTAITAARAHAPDLDPVGALCAVIDATGLRELAAAWGNAAQRQANLDALRAHAVAYVQSAVASRVAPTLVGLLTYFDDTVDTWGWNATRTDRQALLADADAVAVSTWHAAKGREWPLVVLYGLESLREPRAYGMHVETDATRFDLAAPLAGRWLRYWPNPYTTSNQTGPVKDAYAASPEFARVVERADREALRLAYVGWTRARDRLVLAASKGKCMNGLLGTLVALDPTLITEVTSDDAKTIAATWAGRKVKVPVSPTIPSAPTPRLPTPGNVTLGRPFTDYAPGHLSPSTAPPIPCTVGAPVTLGPRMPLHGVPEMSSLGDAVHGFLAADRAEHAEPDRVARAAALLAAHRVAGHLDPADVAAASTRLRAWLNTLGATRLHREWPITEQLATGTRVAGTADLVAQLPAGYMLIDHKSFPGTLAAALDRLPRYSGQLATYARAITAATGIPVISVWIHLPLLGVAVPLTLTLT